MTTAPSPAVVTAATTAPPPSLCRMVVYRAKTRGYALAAIVTGTVDTLDPIGIDRRDIKALGGPMHVHLHVLTPGAKGCYNEHNVPYDPAGAPGTWSWPE